MSYQAYLDNIEAKTGKTPEDFRALAREKGLSTYRDVMGWLKQEFGLGHGHANLIAQLVTKQDELNAAPEDKLAAHFTGPRARWRDAFDALAAKVRAFGPDVTIAPNRSYINLQRGGRKFGILKPSTAARFDVGLKLGAVQARGRLEASGSWNTMVTHRVRITDVAEIDGEVIRWLKDAYEAGFNDAS